MLFSLIALCGLLYASFFFRQMGGIQANVLVIQVDVQLTYYVADKFQSTNSLDMIMWWTSSTSAIYPSLWDLRGLRKK